MRLAGEKGYELGNCDITIVAQEPKLAPYIESMRRRIAEICGCDIDDVSVKATDVYKRQVPVASSGKFPPEPSGLWVFWIIIPRLPGSPCAP